MDQFFRRLAQQLRQDKTTVNRDGLTIHVKEIPDVPQSLIDPRVKHNFLHQPPFGQGRSLQEVRNSMGWDNVDLTDTPIRTLYRTFAGKGGQVPVRVYRTPGSEPKPCMVFYHGGGFFGGSLRTVENPCKLLAQQINGVVVSVDYRLAPELSYPQGFEDCYDAIEWCCDNAVELGINSRYIGVAGDSAGGNLSAVVARKDADSGAGRICFQGLIYPTVVIGDAPCEDFDWSLSRYSCTGEDGEIAAKLAGALRSDPNMLVGMYLQGNPQVAQERYVSPLRHRDIGSVADALIVVAEYDGLRLEGEAYARLLLEGGNNVRVVLYRGMDHAFIDKLGDYPQAEDCINEIATCFLKAVGRRNNES